MKKLGYLLIVLAILASCSSPKRFVNRAFYQVDEGQMVKSKTNLDSALKYDENQQWAKTWYTLGNFHYKVFQADTAPYNELSKTPLVDAYKSYKKAIKLDDKNLYTIKLEVIMPNIKNAFVNKGIAYYEEENTEEAMKSFIYAYQVGKLPLQIFEGTVDSALVYNIGMAAYNCKKYDTAKKYMRKAIELDYKYPGAGIYNILKEIELVEGDTAAALEVLKEGYQAYPEQMLLVLTNFYLQNDMPKEALEYLQIAKEKDAENPDYSFAEGTLYESLEKPEKAIASYEEALEIDPEFFNANYNLGVLYYNKVVDLLREADKIKNNKKYNEAKNEAMKELKKAVPYLEKAEELEPNNLEVLSTLKSVYYWLEMEDEYNRIQKKEKAIKGE